jgi:Methylase involved in ubiquinone/menaquinone biosynthesis
MESLESTFDIADRARAELADLIDLQMAPLGLAAMNELGPILGKSVLDVGCGAGQATLQLSERVGSCGRVIGVDIAPHVLEVARRRLADVTTVSLIQADAARLSLPNYVDFAFSRFGVMFFSNPAEAFCNLKRMLRPGGRMSFVCWRSIKENDLDLVPLAAARVETPDSAHVSFENPQFINDMLSSVGLVEIRVRPFDAEVSCGDIEATLSVVTRVGALGKYLREHPCERPSLVPRVRSALSERAKSGQVSLKAATWIVTARNTSGE